MGALFPNCVPYRFFGPFIELTSFWYHSQVSSQSSHHRQIPALKIKQCGLHMKPYWSLKPVKRNTLSLYCTSLLHLTSMYSVHVSNIKLVIGDSEGKNALVVTVTFAVRQGEFEGLMWHLVTKEIGKGNREDERRVEKICLDSMLDYVSDWRFSNLSESRLQRRYFTL